VLVAALVLTALAARRLRGHSAWPVPALAFAASGLFLYPVAVSRYDAIVALTLAVAALCAALGGRYLLLAYASLGFGAAAKLVPGLATPPRERQRQGRQGGDELRGGAEAERGVGEEQVASAERRAEGCDRKR